MFHIGDYIETLGYEPSYGQITEISPRGIKVKWRGFLNGVWYSDASCQWFKVLTPAEVTLKLLTEEVE